MVALDSMSDHILIVQLRQLGDIMLTTPVLREIKRERPKARITFLSHAMGRMVLEDCPYLDEHFVYDESAGLAAGWQLAKTLRQRHYDLVFDFMNNPRSAFLTRMTGAMERVAFKSARFWAYNTMIQRPKVSDYIVREKFLLLRAAGFTPSNESLVFPWFERHTGPMLHFMSQQTTYRDAPLRVVLSPTHRREARRWPLASYAALADWLVRDRGAQVLWLWGPGEEDTIDKAMGLCQENTLKAPTTSFRESAAIIANADLFVGNSNGPSHIAVATDICSLQLHGHTESMAWCPMTAKHQALQSPQFGRVAMPAMESIVLAAVQEKIVAMDDVIKKQAAWRRERGVRLSWTKR